jgi:hypothetical protein
MTRDLTRSKSKDGSTIQPFPTKVHLHLIRLGTPISHSMPGTYVRLCAKRLHR